MSVYTAWFNIWFTVTPSVYLALLGLPSFRSALAPSMYSDVLPYKKELTDCLTCSCIIMAKRSILEVFEGCLQPFKLLVVGETGSGKTSFLNLLYNCDKVQQNGRKFDEEGMKQCTFSNNVAANFEQRGRR